jgi:hypothetical protein
MTKGSQNKDSKVAFDHAIKSIGNFRKCNGIFHKGYSNGELVPAEDFKRMGDGYQSFCSECDQARQNFQKTLKRLAAIIMVNHLFRINLPKKYIKLNKLINNKIKNAIKLSTNPIKIYTSLVEGKNKLTVKELGFYKNEYSVSEKKEIITIISEKIRNSENDKKISDFIKSKGDEFKFKCSMCKRFILVSEVQPNISQSRDIFDLENKPTNLKLPLHNMCTPCMTGNRAESIRHFKFLCDGRFVEATRKMTEIGKNYQGKNIHADHIVPLRLGGKHDPDNIRPFEGKENIKKKDKITKEALEYLIDNDIEFETLLTSWYVPEYKKYFDFRVKVIEACLRNIVDKKRFALKKLSLEEKEKELKRLYPFLSKKEIDRIIRKCFT